MSRYNAIIGSAAGLLVTAAALAVPVQVTFTDTPECDPLAGPMLVDELGRAPAFPADELIDAAATFTTDSACLPMDDPNTPNRLVVMTNLTGRFFDRVWYVANLDTFYSNWDGIVNGQEAMAIDSVGVNTPLVFESIAANGVFEPGEIWHFIIQDFFNPIVGQPPEAFDFVGVPDPAGVPSSGNIIAIPAPGAAALAVAAGLGALARRRRM